ncbi:MAG: hypothetical protein GX234_03835 [Clostridiales bacterium]|nr:hypothetical protein [Clostridiales bacterium]
MAEYVNLQQEECDETAAQLHALHIRCLEEMREINGRIEQLSEKEGGFYIEKISQKIKELLEALEGQALAVLQETFDSSEKEMETFCRSILETDTAD